MARSYRNTKKRTFTHLNEFDRGQIQALHKQGKSLQAIANEIGCHKSTISRDLKRGSVTQRRSDLTEHTVYFPDTGQVSPFDNSGTKKEGVSRTYKGHDGYALIFAYLGSQEGYAVHVQLREGSTHVQKGTAQFLAESIRYAKQITSTPLLVRMDAGNDSSENLQICRDEETRADFIIKRNLRKESREDWLLTAQRHGI